MLFRGGVGEWYKKVYQQIIWSKNILNLSNSNTQCRKINRQTKYSEYLGSRRAYWSFICFTCKWGKIIIKLLFIKGFFQVAIAAVKILSPSVLVEIISYMTPLYSNSFGSSHFNIDLISLILNFKTVIELSDFSFFKILFTSALILYPWTFKEK